MLARAITGSMRSLHPHRLFEIPACMCAAVALALALAAPAAGVEAGNFQQELVNPAPETTTTAKKSVATQESTYSSGLSGVMILGIAAGGLLLAGIAFVIVRDARSVAPVVEGASMRGTRNPQARLRKRRAKAKIARQHRKKNRRR
jgi:hypothetical protein